MYYICKLPGIWAMYDVQTKQSLPVNAAEVSKLSAIFGHLIAGDGRIFVAIQVGDIAPGKLKGKLAPGAYISKFHNIWGIYDTSTEMSRVLTASEIDLLVQYFPTLFTTEEKIHITVHAADIPPNKIKNIQLGETAPIPIKKPEIQVRA